MKVRVGRVFNFFTAPLAEECMIFISYGCYGSLFFNVTFREFDACIHLWSQEAVGISEVGYMIT